MLRENGFTLLEILVAAVILMMIVMMIGSVFNQMRVAWDVGMRRSKLNVEGRAAATFMGRELCQAVANELLPFTIEPDKIAFYLIEDATDTNRAIYRIRYFHQDETIVREMVRHELSGGYPGTELPKKSGTLAKHVNELIFCPSDEEYSMNRSNLPQFVDIKIKMGSSYQVSRIVAGSGGPDGNWDAEDDNIRTDQ
ncbi:MAG: prepilin-type N-terminal cleavage/methylation domain-containing protein [Verrucomicrobiota bacterium]|nr:prepilin-type N-terminal cleavage/methylation domain-containing protein [Verrucomicrobiota bacterium]